MLAGPDFSLLAAGRTLVAGDVGEQRFAHGKVRRFFQVQQPGQHPPITAAIQDEFRGHIARRAVGRFDRHRRLRFVKAHRCDPVTVKNFHAARGDAVGQCLVEVAARDLVGVSPAGGELGREIEVARPAVAMKDRAVFLHEVPGDDVFQQARLLQQVHAMRQQAFANHEPGKGLLLHQEQFEAFTLQQSRRG